MSDGKAESIVWKEVSRFSEYEKYASRTAYHTPKDFTLGYLGLGIAGEAGEVADKIKKIWRNDGKKISNKAKLALAYELGDVLWYLTMIGQTLGWDLGDIAALNVQKLADRERRGVITSTGDTR